nr:PREDICTED: uncharacterized protein LOC100875621 isoform X2 [Megachile rotundata]XP_012134887.1 PREDICTED: uncharacterized protein LOC100875621 isoform X2 [Megachile rotundata]
MRRMYGDERHINVLKAELEKNDIELKYDEYYHHFSDEHRKYQYMHDYEYFESDSDYEGRGFTSRSFNENSAKRLNKFPKLSEYTRPHFRPTEKSTTSTAATPAPITSSTTETSSTSITPPSTTVSTNTTIENTRENTTEEALALTVTTSHMMKEQNFSINEIPEQIDRIDEELEENDEVAEVSETSLDETTASLPGTTEVPVDSDNSEDLYATPKETTVQEEISGSNEQQEFRPRPEYRPAGKPESSNMEGQLYQDVAAKDQQEQPVLKLRGVNACPVKEEVVAPFWANNTRGEVLALLNLYPFEQYVHWEKCTHENKQMYCRDGCRCEQQYRLHRLLAYDPNNECRGIFSDWFKFPSCCVCRCYDLPLEFRVTSRSPRSQKQRIKVKSPRTRYT